MEWQLAALSVVRAASALCAGILAVYAYRAYRTTHRGALRWLALAGLLLLLGFLGAGVLYQATGSLLQATVLEAPFTLAALLLMMVSLFGRDIAETRRHPFSGLPSEPEGEGVPH